MANKLACSCIQMTYAQLSLTIMGIIAYVSVWLSVGVFICWVWFGEEKGDILVLMCYILHNSAYPFYKSVIITEIIVYEFCMYGNKDFSIWLFITHNSHYWEMVVAITCGYGGYLLPLLAAHSSYTPRFNEVDSGVYCPSVRLSVCGQNCVRSVSSTILIGSISYLHILSSNFRRCVACNARFKIQKFEILANF